MIAISLENGKYEVEVDGGTISVLRHGELWRNETGDSFILSMIHEIESLKEGAKNAKWSLLKLQTGSCTCCTKTPDIDCHHEKCRYRQIKEISNKLGG